MNPLIIYHKDCADGFGAAFAAWRKFGDDAEYVPLHYNDNFNVSRCEGRDVYILDFSFPLNVTQDIMALAIQTTWLDHHKKAFEVYTGSFHKGDRFNDYQERWTIILDDNRSGALIAWNFFHPDTETPDLFFLLDDYDRWVFQHNGTKEINKGLWAHAPWSFPQWLMLWTEQGMQSMYQAGEAILKAHDSNVKNITKLAMPCVINGITGLAVNCSKNFASDVGHELATISDTFGLVWYMLPNGDVSCSLRSNGSFDVDTLARSFDGGGHTNAAGFETSLLVLSTLLVMP